MSGANNPPSNLKARNMRTVTPILYTQRDQRDEYLRMLAKLRDRRFWTGFSNDGFTMNDETEQHILNIEAAIANLDLA